MFRMTLKVLRISLGFILLLWGVVGALMPILPGGFWTIFLGMTVLAYDIPWFNEKNIRLKSWFRRKILRKSD